MFNTKLDNIQNETEIPTEETPDVPLEDVKSKEIIEEEPKENIDYTLKYEFDIVINNTFALAEKSLLLEAKEKWKSIDTYLTDSKYKNIAGMLIDTEIKAIGKGYMILASKYESNIVKICEKYEETMKFIKKILGDKYEFALVTLDKFNEMKEEYIKKIHDGYEYVLMEHKNEIKENNKESKKNKVSSLADIVGEDIIEYK